MKISGERSDYMSVLAEAPGVLGAAMTTYITVVDVMKLLGCKENKAYQTIREVNDAAKADARQANISLLRSLAFLWMWSMR